MATITLNVNDDINEEFREIVRSKLGDGKGILGKAVEDAMRKWILEQKQKEISSRQIMLLKEGVWSKKDYKFNREEIYNEKRGSRPC